MSNHKIVYSTDDSLVTENLETTVDKSTNIDQNIPHISYNQQLGKLIQSKLQSKG